MCCGSASAVVLTSLASGCPHHHLRVSVTWLGDAHGCAVPTVTMPHVCDVLWQRLGCGSHVAGVWPSSARSLCSSQPLSVCLSTSLSPPCSTRPPRPAPTHVTPPSHCSVTSPHRHSTPVCSRLMRLRIGLRGTTHTHTHTHV